VAARDEAEQSRVRRAGNVDVSIVAGEAFAIPQMRAPGDRIRIGATGFPPTGTA